MLAHKTSTSKIFLTKKIKNLTIVIKSTYQWQRLTSLADAISQILPNKKLLIS